jgi:hypothetical protein
MWTRFVSTRRTSTASLMNARTLSSSVDGVHDDRGVASGSPVRTAVRRAHGLHGAGRRPSVLPAMALIAHAPTDGRTRSYRCRRHAPTEAALRAAYAAHGALGRARLLPNVKARGLTARAGRALISPNRDAGPESQGRHAGRRLGRRARAGTINRTEDGQPEIGAGQGPRRDTDQADRGQRCESRAHKDQLRRAVRAAGGRAGVAGDQ